jgi:hypothetical protein
VASYREAATAHSDVAVVHALLGSDDERQTRLRNRLLDQGVSPEARVDRQAHVVMDRYPAAPDDVPCFGHEPRVDEASLPDFPARVALRPPDPVALRRPEELSAPARAEGEREVTALRVEIFHLQEDLLSAGLTGGLRAFHRVTIAWGTDIQARPGSSDLLADCPATAGPWATPRRTPRTGAVLLAVPVA